MPSPLFEECPRTFSLVSRIRRVYISKLNGSERVVAGVGFEPTTFRL